jgi:hypothetical protein
MRFMILITHNEKTSEMVRHEAGSQLFAAYQAYTKDMMAAGVMLAGAPLHGTARGARVRIVEGKRHVTDGPFTEAKEVIGGYYLIEVASREEAIAWAARCPAAGHAGGFAEVREVEEIPVL